MRRRTRVHHVTDCELSSATVQTDGMQPLTAISGRSDGSEKIWMGETYVSPATVSDNHHHGSETPIFVRSGNPKCVFHEGLNDVRIATAPAATFRAAVRSALKRTGPRQSCGDRDRTQHKWLFWSISLTCMHFQTTGPRLSLLFSQQEYFVSVARERHFGGRRGAAGSASRRTSCSTTPVSTSAPPPRPRRVLRRACQPQPTRAVSSCSGSCRRWPSAARVSSST
jgi:hypothetical protein